MNLLSRLPLLIFLFLLGSSVTSLVAQDTTRYCQENGVLFSNCYELIRTTKSAKTGNFTQRTATNDGQVFYGWGSFNETKGAILLTYSKINTYPVIDTKNAKTYLDTLYIKWYSRDNAQEFFRIKFHDSTSTKTYKSDWELAIVKIPKSEIFEPRFELYQGPNKILEFSLTSTRTDYVTIYAEDPRALYLHKRKEKLTKTKFGFTTVGVYTNEKKSNFFEVK